MKILVLASLLFLSLAPLSYSAPAESDFITITDKSVNSSSEGFRPKRFRPIVQDDSTSTSGDESSKDLSPPRERRSPFRTKATSEEMAYMRKALTMVKLLAKEQAKAAAAEASKNSEKGDCPKNAEPQSLTPLSNS